jgi:hypothetical protein
MSAAEVVKAAAAAARAMTSDPGGRGFRKRAREFVDALARVPDYPAAEFTPLEIEQLSSTAEHVIAAIERRIDEDGDASSARQELAESIYDVRRTLEEIHRWRRHFLQSSTG